MFLASLSLARESSSIWNLIVEFANAAEIPEATSDLVSLHKACLQWSSPGPAGEVMSALPAAFTQELRDLREGRVPDHVIAEYRQKIRAVLGWLSHPQRVDRNSARVAFDFLRGCLDSIKWEFHFNDVFKEDRRSSAFYVQFAVDFPMLLSPICLFIWRQMERYRTGDEALNRIVPIKTCARPSCEKFIFVERARETSYCRNSNCRSLHWQAEHKQDRAEKARKQRLRDKESEKEGLQIVNAEFKSKKGGKR